MFSGGELLIVALLALLILGPDKLPGALRQVVLGIRRMRSFMVDIQSGIEKDLGLAPTLNQQRS